MPDGPSITVPEDGNVMAQINKQGGTYKDKAAEDTNVLSKTPYASLPQAPDPDPFTIRGGTKK